MARHQEYIYGNAAPSPIRPIRENEEIRRKSKKNPKKKIDKVALVLAAITFCLVFYVVFNYLQLQFQSVYLSKNVVNLQSEVVELEKKNQSASERIETAIDLTSIYKKATSELGMVQAKNNQVLTYDSKKSNQVRQYGDIPSN